MATPRKSSTPTKAARTKKVTATKKTAKNSTATNTAAKKTAEKKATAKKATAERNAKKSSAGALKPLSESLQTEPGTRRGRATRERLLNAALTVFESKGFLETNVSDICQEAGSAHGTFYIYFKSKEDIWYALVDRKAAERREVTTAPADVPGTVFDRFAYTLRQYFTDMIEHPRWTRTLEQVATMDDKTRLHRLEIRRDFRNRILHGILRLQEAGLADPGEHPEIVAEAIVSMLHNFAYMNIVMSEKQNYDVEDLVETLSGIWARAIGLDTEHLQARSPIAI